MIQKCVPVKRTSIGFKEVLSDLVVLKESDVSGGEIKVSVSIYEGKKL
jgi:hypothetical protein